MEDIESMRALIGDENYLSTLKAITDDASVWIFKTQEEIQADQDLSAEEKEDCKKILVEEKLGCACWFRQSMDKVRTPAVGESTPYAEDYDFRPNRHYHR